MDPPPESSVTRSPLNPNHHYQQPYFVSPNKYYYHIHFSSNCPFHKRIIQPHVHHHPSCKHFHDNHMMTQGNDEAVIEEDGDEEPVFVLTDEWRDFFAKSDAKRKAAKKQARKKEKQ